jgi:hypothetical protein
MRAHSLVERSRAGIGLNDHPDRTEITGFRRCPLEQQATDSRPQQSRLDKELQKVCIRAGNLDLSQTDNRRIALGDLKAGGPEFVRMERQFSPASGYE